MLEHLPEINRAFLQSQIEAGNFENEEEAICSLVDRWRLETEQTKNVQALIDEAEASFARGEGIPYSPELMEQIYQEAMVDFKNGVPVPDHVKP